MNEPIQTKPPGLNPEVQPLGDAIDQFSNRTDAYFFGHATPGAESAQYIVDTGLPMGVPDLFSSTFGLSCNDTEPNSVAINTVQITEKTHRKRRFVIILGVQRFEDPEAIPHRRYLESIIQPEMDEHGHEIHRIDKHFIAGYFDVDAKLFISSPDFDPAYDKRLLESTSSLHFRDPTVLLGEIATSETYQPGAIPNADNDGDDELWVN